MCRVEIAYGRARRENTFGFQTEQEDVEQDITRTASARVAYVHAKMGGAQATVQRGRSAGVQKQVNQIKNSTKCGAIAFKMYFF